MFLLINFFLCAFDELFRQISRISVPAGTTGQYYYFHSTTIFSVQIFYGFHDAASQDHTPCSCEQGFTEKIPALHQFSGLNVFPSVVHLAISSPVRK